MSAPLQRLFKRDAHLWELCTKSGINLVFSLGGIVVRYLFVWLIIHWFGAPMFGSWSLALAFFSITGVLASLGIKLAIVRFVAEARARDELGRMRDAFLKSLVLLSITGVLGGLGLYIASDYLFLIFKKPGLDSLLRIAALGVLPFNIAMLCSGSLRGLRRTTAHSFVENTGIPLFAVGFLVIGYIAFANGYMFALAYVVSLWMTAGISLVLWAWLSGFPKSRQVSGNIGYGELLNVSLSMFINDATRLLRSWTDIIMIGLFCSDLELAAYSLVLRMSALIIIPLRSVNSIAAPKFAEFHGLEDVAGMARIARQSTRIIFWLSMPVLVALMVFSKSVLGIFDSELTFGWLALVIVGIGQFFGAISGSVGQILNMTGHQHVLRNIILFTTGLNVVLNFILIPPFGIEGAAIASTCTQVLSNLLCLYSIKKEFNFLPIYVPLLFK